MYTDNQTPRFLRLYKKLSRRELNFLHESMDMVIENPLLGQKKIGDLSNLYVYKFKIGKTQWLLGYSLNEGKKIITWEAIGQHENYYRDLKRK
ncbi:MAG: type II toxin-antitoxin system RelE/ParE family toxin [Candidatus Planktophila sp.]|nr:type II toxin-antitoxin system RelE/ParE family toxin [Candidatus Planktophila sp.]